MTRKTLNWAYLAGYFDAAGSLSERKHHGHQPRLRIPSYNRELLEELHRLIGSGSINREHKPKGEYFRLDIRRYDHVEEVLEKILPYLRQKRTMVDRWLPVHRSIAELSRLKHRI